MALWQLLTAFAGGSALSTLLAHLLGRRRRTAETDQIITSTATELVREMRAEIARLSTGLADARAELANTRAELGDARTEIAELRAELTLTRTTNQKGPPPP